MSKKDEIIVQSIRDIMNENNLYIYYDKKNTSDRALAYFIDLETFNNVKSAIMDDYETITEKDLNYIKYTDNFFTYKNKTLKMQVNEYFKLRILENLLKNDINTKEIKKDLDNNFSDWSKVKTILLHSLEMISNENNKEKIIKSIEKIYEQYQNKLTEKGFLELIYFHKKNHLSEISMQGLLTNHNKYISDNILNLINVEYPNLYVKMNNKKIINNDEINIFIVKEDNINSQLDMITLDGNQLKQKYPFKFKGVSFMKLEDYEKIIKNMVNQNNCELNMNYFGVNGFKVEDNYLINICFNKIRNVNEKDKSLYFIDNYIKEVEKVFLQNQNNEKIYDNIEMNINFKSMGKKTLEDTLADVNRNNQILKVYITTNFEIDNNEKNNDNNQNKSKENIIKEKKIKI